MKENDVKEQSNIPANEENKSNNEVLLTTYNNKNLNEETNNLLAEKQNNLVREEQEKFLLSNYINSNKNSNEEEIKDFSKEPNKFPITLLEETLNRIGYKKYQIVCIIISLICITAYGINLTIYASMVIPFKKFFKLTDFELSAISSMLYVGTALGHLVTGFITKTFTRRQTVIAVLAFISLLSFIIGFIANKYLFALFRLGIGLGIGTLLPLVINTLSEFLPLYNKGFFIMLAFTGVYIGQLIPNFLMLELNPELTEKNLGLIQIISSGFSVIALILAAFLFEDSPISLVIKKEHQKALALIELMDNKNTYTREKKVMLLTEMTKKFSIEGKEKKISSLFEPKFKKSAILLSLIWLINSILFFGPAIIVSITIDKLGISLDKKTIIENQLKIILIGLTGFFLGGFISEFKFMGRLRTIMLGFLLLSIFVFFTILLPQNFSLFYGMAYASIPMFYFMVTIYTAEFFPSRLRDLGLGFFYFINKIGGLGSQFLFVHLAQIDIYLPFYAIIAMSMLNIIFLALLPYETLDKGMDFMEKIE